jgi:DNA-binding NarL/FixJ family response regulator
MAKRILIVDDSALIRQQIRKLLESQEEIEVCAEARDGAEAVRKVLECHPDLVVLDFLMPIMNGLDAARAIKRLSPALPILIFALDKSPEFERAGQRAGADAVLPKADGGTQLSSVIHRLLA